MSNQSNRLSQNRMCHIIQTELETLDKIQLSKLKEENKREEYSFGLSSYSTF